MYETTHSHHFTDNKLTSGQRTVRDFSTELMKLQDSYNSAIQRRDDAKKELAKEHNSQKLQKWEMEHLANRGRDYKEQLDKVHLEIVGLKSHMPMLGDNFIFPWTISSFCNNFQATNNQNNTTRSFLTEEGCQRCPPGWIFINPTCYYLSLLDASVRRTWWEARKFCQRYKGDLAMVDSTEKHVRYIITLFAKRDFFYVRWNLRKKRHDHVTFLDYQTVADIFGLSSWSTDSTFPFASMTDFLSFCLLLPLFLVLSAGDQWLDKSFPWQFKKHLPQWILDWLARCGGGRDLEVVGWKATGSIVRFESRSDFRIATVIGVHIWTCKAVLLTQSLVSDFGMTVNPTIHQMRTARLHTQDRTLSRPGMMLLALTTWDGFVKWQQSHLKCNVKQHKERKIVLL